MIFMDADQLDGALWIRIHSPLLQWAREEKLIGEVAVPSPAILEELDVPEGERVRHWIVDPDGSVDQRKYLLTYSESRRRPHWRRFLDRWAHAMVGQYGTAVPIVPSGPVIRSSVLSETICRQATGPFPLLAPCPSSVLMLWSTGRTELQLISPLMSMEEGLDHHIAIRFYEPDSGKRAGEDAFNHMEELGINLFAVHGHMPPLAALGELWS